MSLDVDELRDAQRVEQSAALRRGAVAGSEVVVVGSSVSINHSDLTSDPWAAKTRTNTGTRSSDEYEHVHEEAARPL